MIGYKERIVFNASKLDGTPRKLLDVARLEGLGWKYRIEVEDGVRKTYEWFLANEGSLKK